MPSLVHISGGTYVLRGSPASLIYKSGGELVIVDPGHGSKRHKGIRSAVRRIGGEIKAAIITHYHSDHLAVVASSKVDFGEVLASSRDKPLVEDARLRVAITFGYALKPGDGTLPFPAVEVGVTGEIRSGYMELEVLNLPGHTLGQLGIATPDSVLYVADALFGDVVLSRYSVPYHTDPCMALDTLYKLRDIVTSFDHIVPGHGPIMSGREAIILVESNIRAVQAMLELIAEQASKGVDPWSVMTRLPTSPTPGLALLIEQTIRGAIACIASEGRIEPFMDKGIVRWRLAGEDK